MITVAERLGIICSKVESLPTSGQAKILQAVIGYMIGSLEHNGPLTDGYVAFLDGLETMVIEYGESER